MAIENTNNKNAPAGNDAPTQQQDAFAGASFAKSDAPIGNNDFLNLVNAIELNIIDPTVEPYLKAILDLVKTGVHGGQVSLTKLTSMSNSYVFQLDAGDNTIYCFGIQFAGSGDGIHQDMIPTSHRMAAVLPELKSRNVGKHVYLVDCRVILSGYAVEMELVNQMAATITRAFNVTTNTQVRDADISILQSNKFTVSWNLAEAQALSRKLSPHAVPPRMELALTLRIRRQDTTGIRGMNDFAADTVPIAVIGGYTEMRAPEPVQVASGKTELRYRPMFVITELNSVLPLEGVALMLFAALGPVIFNTKSYLRQFTDMGAADRPSLGYIFEDPARRGHPTELKNSEDVLAFAESMFLPPFLAVQLQDGRSNIPGLWRMFSNNPADRQKFAERASNFFRAPQERGPSINEMAKVVEQRFEGTYGRPDGALFDSRNVDYLFVAQKMGLQAMNDHIRSVMLGVPHNPKDRAMIIQDVTHSFTPLWFTSTALLYPQFINWIIGCVAAAGVIIEDPSSQMEMRSLGSFAGDFASTSGMGSIISNNQYTRSMNVSSIWSA